MTALSEAAAFSGGAEGAFVAGVEGPVDFTWFLIVVVKTLALFAYALLFTLVLIMIERKLLARMQVRIGPNRAGPNGWFQSLADGIKLFFKEPVTPAAVDKPVFRLAPVISLVTALLAISVVPVGPPVRVVGRSVALQLVDLNVGILVYTAVAGLGVYGIVLAGWASGSKYPLMGAVRASAQLISYEAAAALALVPVFLLSHSLRASSVVAAQGGTYWGWLPRWYVIPLIVPFFLFLIAGIAETNRPPFDLVEAETELVGGYFTEYSGIGFAVFYLAEYINMVTVSSITATLFLGGWQGPHFTWARPLWGVLWYFAKVLLLLFMFIWIRATLPRLRYDQLMSLGWKIMIPAALAYLVATSFVVAARADGWF